MSRVFYDDKEKGEEVWVETSDCSCRWTQTGGEIKVIALQVSMLFMNILAHSTKRHDGPKISAFEKQYLLICQFSIFGWLRIRKHKCALKDREFLFPYKQMAQRILLHHLSIMLKNLPCKSTWPLGIKMQ